jgi:biotin-(acetyl-CoA carboxylase) ligase
VNNRVQELKSGVAPVRERDKEEPSGVRARAPGAASALPGAISLIQHDGLARDLTGVLVTILDHFERRWDELLGERFDRICSAFRDHCFLTGKAVTIEQPGGRSITGLCRGIDAAGALVVATPTREERLFSGTVAAWDDVAS